MVKSKAIGFVVWLLCFALSIFLLLIIPNSYPRTIFVTLIFDVIAFCSQLIIWLIVLKQIQEPRKAFYNYPVLLVSTSYLIIEMVMCLVIAIIGDYLSFKTAIIINFVIMVIAWIMLVLLIPAKSHVERLDSRQKNHHIEL